MAQLHSGGFRALQRWVTGIFTLALLMALVPVWSPPRTIAADPEMENAVSREVKSRMDQLAERLRNQGVPQETINAITFQSEYELNKILQDEIEKGHPNPDLGIKAREIVSRAMQNPVYRNADVVKNPTQWATDTGKPIKEPATPPSTDASAATTGTTTTQSDAGGTTPPSVPTDDSTQTSSNGSNPPSSTSGTSQNSAGEVIGTTPSDRCDGTGCTVPGHQPLTLTVDTLAQQHGKPDGSFDVGGCMVGIARFGVTGGDALIQCADAAARWEQLRELLVGADAAQNLAQNTPATDSSGTDPARCPAVGAHADQPDDLLAAAPTGLPGVWYEVQILWGELNFC